MILKSEGMDILIFFKLYFSEKVDQFILALLMIHNDSVYCKNTALFIVIDISISAIFMVLADE